ncbi:hypothetical protein [Bacillus sp. UNC437CL72CviS29]|uniref:hypothetical protein n=1 Tax=Bacillus sp. UNC437CL72CviS29 TaxID=1340430 RepID=UPI0012DE5D0D|nr:hypothetical protein [Bacillus sp. UNC437CL72CviS29]
MTILAWISLIINVVIAAVVINSEELETNAKVFSLAIQFPTLLFIVLYLIG